MCKYNENGIIKCRLTTTTVIGANNNIIIIFING